MKAANSKIRTIAGNIMKDVAQFLPMDGFKLSQGILGKEYTVVDVIESEFQGKKTFTVVLQNDETVLNLSAGVLKKARVLSVSDIKNLKAFGGNANIVLRSEADAIWNGSRYFHATGEGMKADNDFTLPEKIHIEFAVIREDSQKPGKGALNPFLYEGYRKVVDEYQKDKRFPTMDDFRAELKKSDADRISGLPAGTEPKPFSYVKEGDPSTMGFTLIFKDTTAKSE